MQQAAYVVVVPNVVDIRRVVFEAKCNDRVRFSIIFFLLCTSREVMWNWKYSSTHS